MTGNYQEAVAAEKRLLCIVDQIGGLSNGAAIRQHHLVRAIAQLGPTEVLVLDPASRGSEADLADALGAGVVVHARPPVRKARALLRMLRHPTLPWRVARSDTRRLRTAIEGRFNPHREPALVWTSSLAAWHAMPEQWRGRTVFDLIDRPTRFHVAQLHVAARRWRRSIKTRSRGSKPLVGGPRATEVAKSLDGLGRALSIERRLARSCRMIVSCNPDEVPRRSSTHHVVPNCVGDPGRPVAHSGLRRVLVPAGFKYPPNLDGAEWFLAEVLPAMRRRLGDVDVVLAGSSPPGFEAMCEAAGATATGWVPDMSDMYEPGTVVLVPLLNGSGTRLKIIEAWSKGVPVVSTPQGAAGLGVRDDVDILLGRSAEAIAAACVRLQSADTAHRIGAAGRRRFEAEFDAAVVGHQLRELLRSHFDLESHPIGRSLL